MPGGPPGAIVVVQRGADRSVHAAGVAAVGSDAPPSVDDHMRVASVAKAFGGAAALSLVDDGVMALDDTIGERLPDLPEAWHEVTLRQLLDHTSGLPDYTATDAFTAALTTSPGASPSPAELLAWVEDKPLVFPSGSQYAYSNSDNITVGTDDRGSDRQGVCGCSGRRGVRAARARADVAAGRDRDARSVVPRLRPRPRRPAGGFEHGLLRRICVGIGRDRVHPGDLNDFIRGYVGGKLYGDETRAAQQDLFIPAGGSEPHGPGANSASMALFRYDTDVRHRVRPHRATSSATRSSPPPRPTVSARRLRRSHCSARRHDRVKQRVSSPRSGAWNRRRSATPSSDPTSFNARQGLPER